MRIIKTILIVLILGILASGCKEKVREILAPLFTSIETCQGMDPLGY